MRAVRPDSESRGIDDGAVSIDLADGRVTLRGETYRVPAVTLGRAIDLVQLHPGTRSFSAKHLPGPGVVVTLPAPHATTCVRVSAIADLGAGVSQALIAIEGPLGREYPDARVAFLGTDTLGEAERIAWATLATFAVQTSRESDTADVLTDMLAVVARAIDQREISATVARDESSWRAARRP